MKKLRLLITVVILLLLHTALFAQNFWEKANGPYSGNIYTIAIDKTSGIMYCGTWDGGIFRSRDNGEHWEEANNGILNSYIYSIIVNNDGTVFAGTPSSIFKSTDFGNSWQNCFYQFPGWIISFAKNSRGEIFAGTNYGKVHLSTNNGINWSEIYNDGYNWIYSIAIDSSDNIFLATSYYGVLVSENNGISWKEKNNGFFIPVIQSININHENGKIFVGANDGIYSSTNSGDEWIRIDSTLSSVKLIRFLSDGGLIANDFFSLWLSEDEGLIWSSITENTEVETQAIKTFVITSKNEIYAGNSGDGIYFSSDKGSTWSFRANGITNVQFKSMLIDHLDNIYNGTYYAGISKTTKG
ncbi:MAG: YCF48-related protein [Ignavibacteria bacterium]|nr:YCF48-related protein [Ignavibacteria bacterium]